MESWATQDKRNSKVAFYHIDTGRRAHGSMAMAFNPPRNPTCSPKAFRHLPALTRGSAKNQAGKFQHPGYAGTAEKQQLTQQSEIMTTANMQGCTPAARMKEQLTV